VLRPCIFTVHIVRSFGTLKSMRIGYARVSAPKQNLDRQIAALRAERCDQIFREKASAKSIKNRPELERAIDALGTDDELVIAEWDRATRSMMDGIHIMQRVAAREAGFKVLDRPFLDLTTPIGKGLLALLSALAEDELDRINRRAAEGRRIAREKGVKFGPKPKLSEHQRSKALDRLAAGERCCDIARDMGVSHSTISRLQKPMLQNAGEV